MNTGVEICNHMRSSRPRIALIFILDFLFVCGSFFLPVRHQAWTKWPQCCRRDVKCIFVKTRLYVLINISSKFNPTDRIDKTPALAQVIVHTVHPLLSFHHYNDVIMSAMASQITSVSIVCSTVCSGADQRKQQSSASLAFVRGIYRWPLRGFLSQMANNAESLSSWRRHHDIRCFYYILQGNLTWTWVVANFIKKIIMIRVDMFGIANSRHNVV